MDQAAAAGGLAGPGALWEAPDLAIERAQDWGQMAVAVFRRGGGSGVWRNPRHRIALSVAAIGPVALSFDGGPTRRCNALPGTLFFYPAGTEVAVAHGPGRAIQVLQDPLLYRGLAPEVADRVLEAGPIAEFSDPLVAQIAQTLALEVGNGPVDRLMVDALNTALAAQFAHRLARWQPPDPEARGLSPERLQRVFDYVEARLGEELTLAELADVACLSPCHFSRCFTRAVGAGPRRYVLRRRVERAREMIRRTDQPLAAIAHALGFADQSHFTNAFRRETGETPARFRAALA